MSRPGPYTVAFLRRVRAWPVSSWRHGHRAAAGRAVLDALAALATSADGRPRPPVPDAGLHALPDQVEVLVTDALDAGADVQQVDALLQRAATELGLRVP
jgi:hypothetical protein